MFGDPVKRRERISDRLYSDLLNGILSGDFPTRSNLPTEVSLAFDYGISRTTVRVALNQLKNEGFVQSRQGSGTVVADIAQRKIESSSSTESLTDLEKCFECRIIFEPEIAGIAAKLRTETDIVYFRDHLNALEGLLKSKGVHTSEDTNFHLHLASLSGNNFLESIMNSLRPYILFGMNMIKMRPKDARELHVQESLQEHRRIVEALIDGDSEKAKSSMFQHLESSRQRIFL